MRNPMTSALLLLTLSGIAFGEIPAPTSQPATYSPQLALSLYHQAKYTECEALCKSAIAQLEKSDGPTSPKLGRPLDDLATIYLRLGKFSDAKPVIDRADSLLDKSTRDGALAYAHLCINKGWLSYSLGDVSRAEAIFTEGRDLIQKYETSPTIDLAELINNLGLTYADNEDENPAKVKEAKPLLFKGWELRKKLTGEVSPESAESLNNIGMHLLFHPDGDNDIPLAITTLEKSAALTEQVYGKDNPETAMSDTNLAVAYHMLQQDDKADALIRKAIPVTEKYLGKESPDSAYELQLLGQLLQAQQKYKQAEDAYQHALTITKNTYGPTNTAVASALDYLSSLYQDMGEDTKKADIDKQITKLRGRDI